MRKDKNTMDAFVEKLRLQKTTLKINIIVTWKSFSDGKKWLSMEFIGK